MTMKDRFSHGEWEAIKKIPLQFAILVALADGEIDDQEFDEINEQLRNALMYKNDLHREVMTDLIQNDDIMEIMKSSLSRVDTIRACMPNREILQSKLSTDEYHEFVHSVFYVCAVKTASASGVGNAGVGKNISREEDFALDTLIALYDIKVDAEA